MLPLLVLINEQPANNVYNPLDASYSQAMPKQHTQSPAVTGTSVLGVKFKDGVVIAADNLGNLQAPL
jgi:20S proteasome subunit beta 7